MLGKMNIEKAHKFYVSSFPFQTFKDRINEEQYELSFGRWEHFDKNIHTLFQRKFKSTLSVEQRWFIFTSVIDSFRVNLDEALNSFADGGLKEIRDWATRKDLDLMLNKVPFDSFQKFENFPYNELFNYSINNYQIIYPNNIRVKIFVADLETYKSASNEIETHKALDKFCKMFN
jgi:hypothetical protein